MNNIADLFDEIAQHAVLSKLKVFGIRGSPSGFARGHQLAIPIPSLVWETHKIDLIAFARSGDGNLIPILDRLQKPTYVDILFRRRDLWKIRTRYVLLAYWNRITNRRNLIKSPKEKHPTPAVIEITGDFGKMPDIKLNQ